MSGQLGNMLLNVGHELNELRKENIELKNEHPRIETYEHIRAVQRNLIKIAQDLLDRAMAHDNSKLLPPEAEIFERCTERLNGLTYGSEEYKEALKDLGPALTHHYESNRHHPEHWGGGITDFNLCDLVEMFCDWCAATMRHENGSISRSCEINQARFKYSDDIKAILLNSRHGMEAKP